MESSSIQNDSVAIQAQSTVRDSLDAQIVKKTMDGLNQQSDGTTNPEYDFQTEMLSADFTGRGTIIDLTT